MIELTEQFLQEHPKIDKAIKRLRGFAPHRQTNTM